MNEVLNSILDFVESVPPVLRILLAGVAIMLETSVLIGLIVPGDTIVLVSSTGVTTVIQFIAMVLAVVVGALIGESLGFAIGRFFGPKLRASWLGQRIGEDRWKKTDRLVKKRGGIAVFISRFLPVFHSVVPMTAGMTAMPYRTFMAWTTPACIIWAFLYVSIGSGAAETYRELEETVSWAPWLFVGILIAGIILITVIKKILEKFAHTDDDTDTIDIIHGTDSQSRP